MLVETHRLLDPAHDSGDLPTALDSEQTLVLAFGGVDTHGAMVGLRKAFPRSHLIGCSTAGEIHQDRIFDDGVTVAVARFDGVSLRLATAPTGPGPLSRDAGREIAAHLLQPDLRAVFVLSGDELARAVRGCLDAAP